MFIILFDNDPQLFYFGAFLDLILVIIVLVVFFGIGRNLKRIRQLLEAKNKLNFRKLLFEKGVSKISIIGVGMITTPGVTFRMFQTLANKKINIQVISTSEIKISVIIEEDFTLKAVKKLHSVFNLD